MISVAESTPKRRALLKHFALMVVVIAVIYAVLAIALKSLEGSWLISYGRMRVWERKPARASAQNGDLHANFSLIELHYRWNPLSGDLPGGPYFVTIHRRPPVGDQPAAAPAEYEVASDIYKNRRELADRCYHRFDFGMHQDPQSGRWKSVVDHSDLQWNMNWGDPFATIEAFASDAAVVEWSEASLTDWIARRMSE